MKYTVQQLNKMTKTQLIDLLIPPPSADRTEFLFLDVDGEFPYITWAETLEEAVIDDGLLEWLADTQEDQRFGYHTLDNIAIYSKLDQELEFQDNPKWLLV